MKSFSHSLAMMAAFFVFFARGAQAELAPVTDTQEKAVIERDWIRNKSLKLTAY